jgi:hypothetical protein
MPPSLSEKMPDAGGDMKLFCLNAGPPALIPLILRTS